MSPAVLNVLNALAVGVSAAERVDLVATLARTLNVEQRHRAFEASFIDEPNAHARKAMARQNRTPEPEIEE